MQLLLCQCIAIICLIKKKSGNGGTISNSCVYYYHSLLLEIYIYIYNIHMAGSTRLITIIADCIFFTAYRIIFSWGLSTGYSYLHHGR